MSSTSRNLTSLWLPHAKTTCTALDLSVDARRVLGILFSGRDCSSAAMSAAVGIRNDEVVFIVREIRASRHPIVVDAVRHGLPLEARIGLPDYCKSVICKQCGQVLSVVPCCKCLIRHAINSPELEVLSDDDTRELPQAPKPTAYRPGSRQKIEIMRERAEQGFSVFREGDLDLAAIRATKKIKRRQSRIWKERKVQNGCRIPARAI